MAPYVRGHFFKKAYRILAVPKTSLRYWEKEVGYKRSQKWHRTGGHRG